jgi:hypothetical protein
MRAAWYVATFSAVIASARIVPNVSRRCATALVTRRPERRFRNAVRRLAVPAQVPAWPYDDFMKTK